MDRRRPNVPEADELLGIKQPVLSHGYVVLVDYMGNDAAIVQAARVSYGKGTKSVRDDQGLIRYLLRHRAYDAVRDGRTEVPCPAPDLRRSSVDPASHGLPRRRDGALVRRPSVRRPEPPCAATRADRGTVARVRAAA